MAQKLGLPGRVDSGTAGTQTRRKMDIKDTISLQPRTGSYEQMTESRRYPMLHIGFPGSCPSAGELIHQRMVGAAALMPRHIDNLRALLSHLTAPCFHMHPSSTVYPGKDLAAHGTLKPRCWTFRNTTPARDKLTLCKLRLPRGRGIGLFFVPTLLIDE